MKFTVGVDDEVFQFWLKEVKSQFRLMTETMAKVVEEVRERTMEETPIETGRLSRSFRDTYLTRNSQMIVVQVRMSALNPRTGYDYALIQHEYFGYKHSTINLGFKTYRDFGHRKENDFFTFSSNVSSVHGGRAKYLERGIVFAQHTAMEIIEKDYLSMFNGGFIV